MKIIDMKKGMSEDGETCFCEVGFHNENGSFWVFCIEVDELCLLVRSGIPMLDLAGDLGFSERMGYEMTSCGLGSDKPEKLDIKCDLYELAAYCTESELEHYECWKHDGGEGIYTAGEADNGIAFIIAYGLMQRAFYPDSDFCASLSTALDASEEIDAAEVEKLFEVLIKQE